jgi:hypothetical protein
LERSAEREVWATESEDLVAAGQGSGGTSVDGSVFWCSWEGEPAIVRVSSLEESLGVSGREGEECCREKFDVSHG